MAQATPAPMCPMAETCRRMMSKPLSGFVMLIPGIAFAALGVLIIIWPSVLPYLVAAALILAGCAMLMMANFMRRIGTTDRHALS